MERVCEESGESGLKDRYTNLCLFRGVERLEMPQVTAIRHVSQYHSMVKPISTCLVDPGVADVLVRAERQEERPLHLCR